LDEKLLPGDALGDKLEPKMMIAGVAVSESDVCELIILLRLAGLDAVATNLDRDADVEAHRFNLTSSTARRCYGSSTTRPLMRSQAAWRPSARSRVVRARGARVTSAVKGRSSPRLRLGDD
jgi:hypothetical protein